MKYLAPGQITTIIGLPRSGKTMFAAKIAKINEREFDWIVSTHDMELKPDMFEHAKVVNLTVEEIFAWKWDNTLFILDEGSLNGLDSRSFQKNFAGEHGARMLATLKTLGHSGNAAIITNHGMNDTDGKIRDSLSGTFFRARGRVLWWCFLEQLTIDYQYVPEQGKYVPVIDDCGSLVGLISGAYHFVLRRKWGRYYDSYTIPPILAALPHYGEAKSKGRRPFIVGKEDK